MSNPVEPEKGETGVEIRRISLATITPFLVKTVFSRPGQSGSGPRPKVVTCVLYPRH
jgi:hypothetical protein